MTILVQRGRFLASACIAASASLLAAAGERLPAGSALEFTAVLPEKSGFTVSFGRGRERFSVDSQGGEYRWAYLDENGVGSQMRWYPGEKSREPKLNAWWEKCAYSPNGRFKRSFSLPDGVAAWSAGTEAERHVPLSRRKLRVGMSNVDGRLAFSLDGIVLHAVESTADLDWRDIALTSRGEAELSPMETGPAVSTPGFWCVDIDAAATLAGNPLAGRSSFEGVPVKGCRKSVDVSRSWVREASMDEYGAPESGTFGGRWAGALSCNPFRLQFRVPNADYSEMYVVASCRERNFLAVQFYRPCSGFPVAFAPAEPIRTDGSLQLLRIPLRRDLLSAFSDRGTLEFELVPRVITYLSTPEPCYTSSHGGGEPSGVKVHAITLKEAGLGVAVEPAMFGNVWTGTRPAPSFSLRLENRRAEARKVPVEVRSESYDGGECTTQRFEFAVAPRSATVAHVDVPVRKFGHHSLRFTVDGEAFERSFAVLKPRETKMRGFDAPGVMFGTWPAGTTHYNMQPVDQMRLSMQMGVEAYPFGDAFYDAATADLARRYGARDFTCLRRNDIKDPLAVSNLAERLAKVLKRESDGPAFSPTYQWLYAEPGGIGETSCLPELYGERRVPRTEEEEARYARFKEGILRYEPVFREVCPGRKLLMPWGAPAFAMPFLEDPDTREKFDGIAYDNGSFDRIPEAQMGACSLYCLTVFNWHWRRYRKSPPVLISIEGPCLSRVAPGSLTQRQSIDHHLRCNLLLTANGLNRLFATISGHPDSLSYWGEQHYSDGAFHAGTIAPYPHYSAQATMIRILRNAEFVRAVPTGSLGVFNLEYRDSRTGAPINAVWCIRGRIPFKVKAREILDAMDNRPKKAEVSSTPVFIVGATGPLELGVPVYDDDTPRDGAVCVADLADWTVSEGPADDEYENCFVRSIRRFRTDMSVSKADGRLSVALRDDDKGRGIMPQFTVLAPHAPVRLPGRPQTLALDVEAKADWGRVAYLLRDSKGERFISTGRKDVYNCDDPKHESHFTFDGRRMVRMEMPATLEWDGFRMPGFVWWGSYDGDGRVDYPLFLEKVFVERRAQAMYVNDLVDAPRAPVLLGKLYAEDFLEDGSERMPAPPQGFKPVNPFEDMKGSLPASTITAVRHPDHYYDGTRGHFDFREMPEAVSYDIYVSLSPDGAGAILLGRGVKSSGALVRGFLPNRDNYAFIVWSNKKGEKSRVSEPFKFRLNDDFANK